MSDNIIVFIQFKVYGVRDSEIIIIMNIQIKMARIIPHISISHFLEILICLSSTDVIVRIILNIYISHLLEILIFLFQ